jgi:hypothetical protein
MLMQEGGQDRAMILASATPLLAVVRCLLAVVL